MLELLELILPAIACGVMVALTHAPLGIQVLRRGIIFLDLAIAQIAGLGLVVALVYFEHLNGVAAQISAVSLAILAALTFRYLEKKDPRHLEAYIGVSFVLSASLSMLLLADFPHGGEEVQHLLSGQILFVTWDDVLAHLPVYLLVLFLWFKFPKIQQSLGFYVLFALAITSSVQLVGVYVVFSSLILPALAVVKMRKKLIGAWVVGVTSMLLGILVSTYWDFVTGSIIVCSYVLIAIVASFVYSVYMKKFS